MSVVLRTRGNDRDDTVSPRNTILLGDATERLHQLSGRSIDCVVTSPPYYLLRDYGSPDQIGLEPTVDVFVERLTSVLDQLARVLKPTGSLWLNLGDSYSRDHRYGAMPKGLLLAPERVALAMTERGWVLRNKVIWHKTNPMPSPVTDRLNTTWEYLFHFVRSPTYFYDLAWIREPHRSQPRGLTAARPRAKAKTGPAKYGALRPSWAGPLAGSNAGLVRAKAEGRVGHRLGRNPGDVWRLATAGYRGSHFAVFPERLVERPLRATCPAQVCRACGAPWSQHQGVPHAPTCACAADVRRGLVLDPFIGSGTTAVVAREIGRDWLGIELNSEFRQLALQRIASTVSMVDQRSDRAP